MRWLLMVFTMVLFTACSAVTGGESRDQPPDRSASDLATVRAQAGLDDATPTRRASRPTPTTKSAVPTSTVETRERNPGLASDETMLAALIEPRDIATTWTRGGYDGYGTMSYCGAPALEDQFEQLGWAYGSYTAVGGQWAEQWVLRLSEPDAQAAMDYARSTLTCERYTYEGTEGNDIYWDLDSLDIPADSDDLFALTVDITFQNPVPTPQFGNIVFARQGEFVVLLFHYGFRIDSTTTIQMTQAAVARLALVRDNSV